MCCCSVFFVKQKTAYGMRISDWSSDVCSSDLLELGRLAIARLAAADPVGDPVEHVADADDGVAELPDRLGRVGEPGGRRFRALEDRLPAQAPPELPGEPADRQRLRSEEHTSELQSLMRISYAVFCLKKKNKSKDKDRHQNNHKT